MKELLLFSFHFHLPHPHLPNPINRLRERLSNTGEHLKEGASKVVYYLNPFGYFADFIGNKLYHNPTLGKIVGFLGHYGAMALELLILFLVAIGIIIVRMFLGSLGNTLSFLGSGKPTRALGAADAFFIRLLTEDIGAMADVLGQHLIGSLITLLGYGILALTLIAMRPRLKR